MSTKTSKSALGPWRATTHMTEKYWEELRIWTSDHTQSLSRCVRGVCNYGAALRFLARAEGYDEDEIETLVAKVRISRVLPSVRKDAEVLHEGSADRQKAEDINELILNHPELRVCFVQTKSDTNDAFASCSIGCDRENRTLSLACKVELPGNPIIGEGKPENQNHAVIFSRGAYLQTSGHESRWLLPGGVENAKLARCFL